MGQDIPNNSIYVLDQLCKLGPERAYVDRDILPYLWKHIEQH